MAGYQVGTPQYVHELWTSGQEVQYLSSAHKQWLDTTISVVHTDGTVEVANKPGGRLNYQVQCQKLRVAIEFEDDGTAHRIAGRQNGKGDGLTWTNTTAGTKAHVKHLEIGEDSETKMYTLTGPFGMVKIATPKTPSSEEKKLMRQLKVSAYSSGVSVNVRQSAAANLGIQAAGAASSSPSYEVGQKLQYYSTSHSKWVPCVIVKIEGDSMEISCKAGQLLPIASLTGVIRPATADDDTPEEEEGLGSGEWQLVKKSGLLYFTGEDDKNPRGSSYAECEAIVKKEPDLYAGFTFGAGSWYIRKKGAAIVSVAGWETHLLQCIALKYDGKLFEDAYTKSSRFPGGLENGKGQGTQLHWKRPGRGEGLLDVGKLSLYQSIHPNDVKQGSVGDCSLIASIACLCEFPELIKRIFGKCHKGMGRYEVILMNWGTKQRQTYLIDDRFACKSADDPLPCFAQASEDIEIFPMLIEKAVAIMLGGYDFMSAIMPTWALGVLTGCDNVWSFSYEGGGWTGSKQIYDGHSSFETVGSDYNGAWPDGSSGQVKKSNEEVWRYLEQWDQQGYLMCAGCSKMGMSDTSANPIGILYVHAYSLLQVKSNVAGSGKSLAQLRNPHGLGGKEPDTMWSDNGPAWKSFPAVEQACIDPAIGHQADGLFWIEKNDFFGPNGQNFNCLYIVKMKRN